MPEFRNLDAGSVKIGRSDVSLEPYIATIRGGDAGILALIESERPGPEKRRLQEAAKIVGVKLRSSVRGNSIVWKKVGS